MQERYVELLNIEMGVMNILETKAYEPFDKKGPSDKELTGLGGRAADKMFIN